MAKDAKRNRWVMFAAEISMHCGLNSWYLLSRIVRASAADPEGPYEHEAVVVDYLGHQPTLAFDPQRNRWVMFHQGGGGNCSNTSKIAPCTNGSSCHDGRCSAPASVAESRPIDLGGDDRSRTGDDRSRDRSRASADCMGNFVMSTLTDDIAGEWGPQIEAGIPDNPTAIILPNGTTLLIGRGFGNSNVTGFDSFINMQVGASWKGPYANDCVGPSCSNIFPDLRAPGWEDGFAFRRRDGTYHAVFHGMTQQNLSWACKGEPQVFPGALHVLPCPEPTFRPSPWVGRHAWSLDGRTVRAAGGG